MDTADRAIRKRRTGNCKALRLTCKRKKERFLYETSKEKLFLRPKDSPKQETIVTFIL